MNKKGWWVIAIKKCIFLIGALAVLLMGCSTKDIQSEKVSGIQFTVVPEEELPEQLRTEIDKKKQDTFKMTFLDQNYLYICVGYGEQTTGGYSIQVNDLYLTQNAVYIDTNLIGPEKDEKNQPAVSYPYIVVKIQRREEPVVFE